jgi:amino acid transporter
MGKWEMVFWFMVGTFALLLLIAVLLSWVSYKLINRVYKKKKSKPVKILIWCGLLAVFVPFVIWAFAYITIPEELRKYDRELRSATQENIDSVNAIEFDYVMPVSGDDPEKETIAYPCVQSRYLNCDWQGRKINGEVKAFYYIPGTAVFYTYKDGHQIHERRYEVGRLVEEHDRRPLSEDGLYGTTENRIVYCKDGRIISRSNAVGSREEMCGKE